MPKKIIPSNTFISYLYVLFFLTKRSTLGGRHSSHAQAWLRPRRRREREVGHRQNKMSEAKERGNALYKAGKFAQAVAAYDESISEDPTKAPVHANKAAALSGQGRAFFPEAVRAVVKACAIDPLYERARQRLGSLIVKMGELDTAVDAAEEHLRQDPESKGAISLLRQLRSLRDGRTEGNAAFKEGDKEKARGLYSAALARAVAVAAAGGGSEAGTGDDTPAPSAEVEAAVPGAALLLCNRAACASALGDHAGAFADAEAALGADPEYVKASLRRALTLDDFVNSN